MAASRRTTKKARPKAAKPKKPGKRVVYWPASRVKVLLDALEFSIARLTPYTAKSPLIAWRRDQYLHLKKALKSARLPKDGHVTLTIHPQAAALIKPVVLAYAADLQRRLKKGKRK